MFSVFGLSTKSTSCIGITVPLDNLVTSWKFTFDRLPKENPNFQRDPGTPNCLKKVVPTPSTERVVE